jgi:hypothetical protein
MVFNVTRSLKTPRKLSIIAAVLQQNVDQYRPVLALEFAAL